ncbi:hypothetical protein PV327_003044 [Microctonus hyperodae]|uniref:USP domain-containing protein n=1 Tax=Microctonus hyperodae TaxID=165561 RepID=A0AA39L0R5_MICHY|nr:hypothetical protein PV327_003044 [Microctonus hyperodae]
MDFTKDTLLEVIIKLIISSTDKEQINQAWKMLENLEKNANQKCVNLIDTVKKIITEDKIENVNEIPKLLTYFSNKINENPFEVSNATDINNGYINFLNRIVDKSKNFNLLCDVVETLLNHHKIYLPNDESIQNFSTAIVHCLSLFSMPTNPTEVIKFKENTGSMHKHLTTACNLYKTNPGFVLILMNALYKIITDIEIDSVPGTALVVIIQLVEPKLIPQSVQFVRKLSNDQQLSQLVSILSTWLTQWLKHDTLYCWVKECIEDLQIEHRYSVLNSITDNCLDSMLARLIFPIARVHIMPIVRTMLIHMSDSSLLIKIIPNIVKLFEKLREDNSQDGLLHTQDLVNCVNVLIMRFQGLICSESLMKSFPMKPQGEIVKELMTTSLWRETTDKLPMNNYNIGISNNKQVGLDNLGNTCYMNSVLQALVMTPQFCNQILIYNEYSIKTNSILYELQRLFALLVYSKRPCLSPNDFSRVSKPAYFMPGQQQDSAEFLCHLLDVLYEQEQSMVNKFKESNVEFDDEILNKDIKMNLQEHEITSEDNNSNNCDTIVNNKTPKNHSNLSTISQSSLIYQVFGGELNTTYQCNKCYTSSHNNDHYWELQLSFPEEIDLDRKVNVQDLINYYLTPEKLTGDNMYHCNKCNSLCDAQRIIKILRAPSHLILTLKHFHYDIDSRLKAKLFHKVFYNEIIQIPVSNDDENDFEKYQLYAAVVHSGYSMDYGHYFTFAKDRTEKWYKFNDSCVTETTLNEFYQLEAPYTPYILFYAKITNNFDNESNEKPILQTLSDNIRNIIETDTKKYEIERKNYDKSRITRLPNDDYYQLPTSLTRQRDNDDDNPPPTNCRNSVDIQSNRFLY